MISLIKLKEQFELSDSYLDDYYKTVKNMIEKFKITKQYTTLRELIFFHDCIKEESWVNLVSIKLFTDKRWRF